MGTFVQLRSVLEGLAELIWISRCGAGGAWGRDRFVDWLKHRTDLSRKGVKEPAASSCDGCVLISVPVSTWHCRIKAIELGTDDSAVESGIGDCDGQ